MIVKKRSSHISPRLGFHNISKRSVSVCQRTFIAGEWVSNRTFLSTSIMLANSSLRIPTTQTYPLQMNQRNYLTKTRDNLSQSPKRVIKWTTTLNKPLKNGRKTCMKGKVVLMKKTKNSKTCKWIDYRASYSISFKSKRILEPGLKKWQIKTKIWSKYSKMQSVLVKCFL